MMSCWRGYTETATVLAMVFRTLRHENTDGTFTFVSRVAKRNKHQHRNAMQVGDRVLVKKELRRDVLIVARVDVPHSTQKVFLTRSGGDFTIGLKIWKSDYTWNEKDQLWVSKR